MQIYLENINIYICTRDNHFDATCAVENEYNVMDPVR